MSTKTAKASTSTRATAPAKATRRTTTKATDKATDKASTRKATSKATSKASPKAETTAPKAPVLTTKSGVPHPCTEWTALIAKAGLTQTGCAKAMGVAPMTMSRLMRGHGIPTANITIKFCEATGANLTKTWRHVADYELALALDAQG